MESASLMARLPMGIPQSIYPVQIRHQLGRALQSLGSSANHRDTHFARGALAMQPHVDITRDRRQLRGYHLHDIVVPPTFSAFIFHASCFSQANPPGMTIRDHRVTDLVAFKHALAQAAAQLDIPETAQRPRPTAIYPGGFFL